MSVSRLSKKNFSNPVCILRFTSTSSFSQQNKLLVSQRGFKQIIVTVSHNVMKEHTSSLVFRNHFSSSKQAGFQHSAGSYSASDRNKPCKQMSATHTCSLFPHNCGKVMLLNLSGSKVCSLYRDACKSRLSSIVHEVTLSSSCNTVFFL